MNHNTKTDLEVEIITAEKLVKDFPDGTGGDKWVAIAHSLTGLAAVKTEVGQVTRADRLLGRALECFASGGPDRLRKNLLRLAAFALIWAEALESQSRLRTGRK